MTLAGLHCSEQSCELRHRRVQSAWLPEHCIWHCPVALAQSTEQFELPVQLIWQSLPVQRK
jgi:hypothetical protein